MLAGNTTDKPPHVGQRPTRDGRKVQKSDLAPSCPKRLWFLDWGFWWVHYEEPDPFGKHGTSIGAWGLWFGALYNFN